MIHDQNPILAFVWSGWTATWPTALLAIIWAAWLISWGIGAFFSARTEKHVRTWDSRAYRIPILLGAILLTGYLGGAVATHLRVGNPVFSHTLFGVYIGVMAWAGLWLRDPRLRALLPFSPS